MMPLGHVLAAVDFSPGSRAALPFADRLAKQCGAQLHLLHAIAPCLMSAANAAGTDLPADIREELQILLGASTSRPVGTACYHAVAGEAGDVIMHTAAREGADLIVLGTRGSSPCEWPALGATLEDVLHRTTVSLLAVPAAWSPPCPSSDDLTGIGPVIAGVDMTCPSIEAAAAAGQLAAALRTDLLLIHAVPPPQTGERWHALAEAAAAREFEAARPELERVTSAICAHAGGRATFVTEYGDVAHVLTQAATAHPDAIVVLGRGTVSHAYGPPGSIAARTLVLGRVPVLVHGTG